MKTVQFISREAHTREFTEADFKSLGVDHADQNFNRFEPVEVSEALATKLIETGEFAEADTVPGEADPEPKVETASPAAPAEKATKSSK